MENIFESNYSLPTFEDKTTHPLHLNSDLYIGFNSISDINFLEPINFFDPNFDLKAKKVQDTTIFKSDEKTTTLELTKNGNLYDLKNQYLTNRNPYYYSYEKIKQILIDINSSYLNVFQKNEKIIKAEYEMQLIRIKNINLLEIKDEIKNKNELEKKKKNDKSQRAHDKYTSNNIMIKIKTKLFEYLIIFVNKILKKYNEGKEKKDKVIIYELNYKKYINISIKDNIKSLNLSLKDLLSQEISDICKKAINSNKENIEKILKEEKDDEIIKYLFNLKFKDWLNIFTKKKDVQSFGSINDIECEEIKNVMPNIDDFLNEIYEKNKGEDDIANGYISCIIFYLFNYENWFIIKSPRKT